MYKRSIKIAKYFYRDLGFETTYWLIEFINVRLSIKLGRTTLRVWRN